MTSCGSVSTNNLNNSCATTNWIANDLAHSVDRGLWTISDNATDPEHAFAVFTSGSVDTFGKLEQLSVYPVVYLSPNIKLTGDGTSNNPYKIATEEPKQEETIAQTVNVPPTALYTSMLILAVGLLLIIVAIVVIRKVTKKSKKRT